MSHSPQIERATLSPEECVCEVIDTLLSVAKEHEGLLPSCLTFEERAIPEAPPTPIEGQRPWDRSWRGCNLMHDLPLLKLAYSLAEFLDRPSYRDGADDYLRTFLQRCSHTPTGLLPWGEHAFWDLKSHSIGNSCAPETAWHDHLRQAPPWFWKKVTKNAPNVLQRFADGLDWHWVNDGRDEYNRHAPLLQLERVKPLDRSCDFPRHSGFFVQDLACAYSQQRREQTRSNLLAYADYWWDRRIAGECLAIESRTPQDEQEFYQILSPSQTLSLGLSLLESADVLREADPSLSEMLRQRGTTYCFCFLKAPHDLAQQQFVSAYSADSRLVRSTYPLFGSVYGIFPAAQAAVLCCAAYRYLREPGFLNWALAVGALLAENDWANAEADLTYQGRKSTPHDAPALDTGLTLELMADLYDLTGEREWLEKGACVWRRAHQCYFRNGLIALASNGEWYEAQQGSAYLLHGAARLGLFISYNKSIAPEYSAR